MPLEDTDKETSKKEATSRGKYLKFLFQQKKRSREVGYE